MFTKTGIAARLRTVSSHALVPAIFGAAFASLAFNIRHENAEPHVDTAHFRVFENGRAESRQDIQLNSFETLKLDFGKATYFYGFGAGKRTFVASGRLDNNSSFLAPRIAQAKDEACDALATGKIKGVAGLHC